MLQRARSVDFSDTARQALAAELEQTVKGEVRFDPGSRALYATDGSNYRQPPIGVVIPKDKEDVIQAVAAAHRHGAPILSRGCGTSLAGQCCNTAVVIDMSKYMNQVLEVNPQERFARVQPGVVLDVLREAVEAHHLTFAPDPATHTHNTLGGMIGNNSCGVHSVMGGRTSDNILELDILTYDGTRTCTAVFRDELINLYPHDPQAKRLSQQTFTLGEFLSQRDFPDYHLRGRALVHAHCNHKAIMGMNREQELLSRLGLDFEILNAGCCGQAGSFGYEVSIKCSERALAPAVRVAEPDTLIIADGFSCREQIAYLTERRGLHLAQVLKKALHGAGSPKRHES